MKTVKLILLFLDIVLVSSGATYAYFTKTKQVANNRITAGTLDISIEKDDSGAYYTPPVDISGMMPGDMERVAFYVKNSSTVGVNLSGKISGEWLFNHQDKYMTIQNAYYLDGLQWKPLDPDISTGTYKYRDLGSSTLKVLGPGETREFMVEVKFDINATDEYQGKTYKATLEVAAVQEGGPFPAGH